MFDEKSAVGQVVKHTVFGMGIICSVSDERVIVDFGNNKKKFIFPDVFEKFLEATNDEFGEYVNELIMKRKPKVVKKAVKQEMEVIPEDVEDELEEDVEDEGEENVVEDVIVDEGNNIAFNCNLCDGGRSRKQIGYNGICSSSVIEDNINVKKRPWCSDSNCPCCRFLNGEINRDQLEEIFSDGGFVCYESEMLSNWKKFDGYYVNGNVHEMFGTLNRVRNSLCVLTTVNVKDDEKNRYIFALFLIEDDDKNRNDFVKVKSKYKIKLSPKQSDSLLFWDYSNLPHNILWNKDNFTYFGNKMGANILRDVAQIKRGTKDEKLAWEMYEHFCKSNGVEME